MCGGHREASSDGPRLGRRRVLAVGGCWIGGCLTETHSPPDERDGTATQKSPRSATDASTHSPTASPTTRSPTAAASDETPSPTATPTPAGTPASNLTTYPATQPTTDDSGPFGAQARFASDEPGVRLARTREEWDQIRQTIDSRGEPTGRLQFVADTAFDRECLVVFVATLPSRPGHLQLRSVDGVGGRSVELRVRGLAGPQNAETDELLLVRLPAPDTGPRRATVVLVTDGGSASYATTETATAS